MTERGATGDGPEPAGGAEREEQASSVPNQGQEPRLGGAAAEGFADAIGHLQTAAMSMVAAIRSALDGAEHLAREVAPLFDLVTEAAQAGQPTNQPTTQAEAGPRRGRAAPSRVQHIPVSTPPRDGGPSARPPDDEPGAGDDG